MKDIDEFITLFNRMAIGYNRYETKDNTVLEVREGATTKVKGYVSFYTEFVFDKDGKFLEMGAYE